MPSRSGKHKAPLYRKENKTAYNYQGDKGGDYRHSRHTKQTQQNALDEIAHQGMKSNMARGRDYTPLFRFLLSKVGLNWDAVYSEAVSRLDTDQPIFWMVALREEDKEDTVRIGESTYWSGLYVDTNNTLQIANPNVTVNDLYPGCNCCTHTFNGIVFPNKFKP
jgi:hypothetical protein